MMTHKKQRASTTSTSTTEEECPVCLEIMKTLVIVSPVCNHVICQVCAKTLVDRSIYCGGAFEVPCPMPHCEATMSTLVLADLCSKKQFQFLQSNMLQASIEDHNRDKIFWCPKCDVPMIGPNLDQCPDVKCAICEGFFCFHCGKPWDNCPGKPCLAGKDDTDLLTRNRSVKKCPKCKLPIEKEDGCNEMTCAGCGCKFCWVCGQRIAGQFHFTGRCPFFDEPENQRHRLLIEIPILLGIWCVAPCIIPFASLAITVYCFYIFVLKALIHRLFFGPAGIVRGQKSLSRKILFGTLAFPACALIFLLGVVAGVLLIPILCLILNVAIYCIMPIFVCCDLSQLDEYYLRREDESQPVDLMGIVNNVRGH